MWNAAMRPTVAALIAMAVLVACSGPGATPTPSVTPTPVLTPSAVPTVAPTAAQPSTPGAVLSPAASALPTAAADPSESPMGFNPDRTVPPGMQQWPESVVNATVALAATDNELRKAAADFAVGAREQDVELLVTAAQGMAFLARESIANAERLGTWVDTQAVSALLIPVYQELDLQGSAFADAALAGDAAGVESAAIGLGTAMESYGAVRDQLLDRAELALVMRRGLLVR